MKKCYATVELTDFSKMTTYLWKYEFDDESIDSLREADHKVLDLFTKAFDENKNEFPTGEDFNKLVEEQEVQGQEEGTFSFIHFGSRRVDEHGLQYTVQQASPVAETMAPINAFSPVYDSLVKIGGEPHEKKSIVRSKFFWSR